MSVLDFADTWNLDIGVVRSNLNDFIEDSSLDDMEYLANPRVRKRTRMTKATRAEIDCIKTVLSELNAAGASFDEEFPTLGSTMHSPDEILSFMGEQFDSDK